MSYPAHFVQIYVALIPEDYDHHTVVWLLWHRFARR